MRILLAILLLNFGLWSGALALTAEALVPGADYDATVPAPSEFFPVEPAVRHLRHDQLVAYFRALADASPRVSIQSTGRTHEFREQVLVAISHPDNIARLDELRQAHLARLRGEAVGDTPLIVWLGYSIHGNEASGSNAAPLAGYHFAASAGAEAWLSDTIVLIDPSLNPDGMGRFAHWVNMHRGYSDMADPENREQNEGWPGGRFNHYWFDLNRDWLPIVHPESANRVEIFQTWRPHVFADFHEMGSNSTYFFQPGVPERKNPLTAARNVELTQGIAEFHAKALDAVNQLYFTEEVFDDYYYGKGSTYPDVQGSVGILFEQGSVRGHQRASLNGVMDFSWAVRNQFLTSLSTVEGAVALADELKSWQREWIDEAPVRARKLGIAGWVFGSAEAPYRSRALAERLAAHRIDVFRLAQDVEVDGRKYEAGVAWYVPAAQSQVTLARAIFEKRTTFEDTTFYDVSTWTFPLAFGVPYGPVRRANDMAGAPFDAASSTAAARPAAGAYAYLIEWDHYLAPRALTRLQQAGIPVRVATEPFSSRIRDGGEAPRAFERGTLLVARGLAGDAETRLDATLAAIASEDGVTVFAVDTGLTPRGIDLGSGSFEALEPVRPILVTGDGVYPPDAGEVWHLLDTRIGLAPAMIDSSHLLGLDLDDYTHIMLVSGRYSGWSDDLVDRIRTWVRDGGVLVTTRTASAWATEKGLTAAGDTKREKGDRGDDEPVAPRAYGDHSDDFSKTVIGGAIVRASVDTTHPMAYGYREAELAVFRNSSVFLKPSDNPYATPLRYTEDPLISGYVGDARLAQLAGSAAVIAERLGGGSVIRFADNPNFRGFWLSTNKLFLNALFFGGILDPTPVPDTDERL